MECGHGFERVGSVGEVCAPGMCRRRMGTAVKQQALEAPPRSPVQSWHLALL